MNGDYSALPGLGALSASLAPADARQLVALRALQLRRAQQAVAEAQEAVQRAQDAMAQRQAKVLRIRESRRQLLADIGGALAPRLPQWAACASSHRAWLDEQLEREEYALVNDERLLEQAQDRLAQRQRELARCDHRQALATAVRGEQRKTAARAQEQRQEIEREDCGGWGVRC